MSPEEKNVNSARLLPRCQYCGESPPRIAIAEVQIADGHHAVYVCANPECRAVFSIQLIGLIVPQDKKKVQPVENRLVVPN